ncbi:MAG: sulfite exporter TauE/SafE family protein [Desulfobacterales bacterium]|nr:sulfite exporter TauE/SafE family protein [Desulfobacterales bacterium]
MNLHYWFMFPVGVLIATIAMSSGVGGATFFSPLFILALGISPEVAIGTGLITEVFGFASGVYAYVRRQLIDYKLGVALLMVTIPMALVGTWAAGHIDPEVLKVILGVGLFAVATSFLRAPEHKDVMRMDRGIEDEYGGDRGEACLNTARGEEICYTVCNRTEGRLIAGLGGLFVGMISTGLGELNGYFLLQRCRVPSKVSVATSVFVVAITALSASSGHFLRFAHIGGPVFHTVLNLVVFTVPGVILGAQLGARVASYIPQRFMERGLGVLFVLVAAITLGEVIL